MTSAERRAEWNVVIRCPGCGRQAGQVTKWPDNPMQVNLLTVPIEFMGCIERECPALRWPTEVDVLAAAERALQRPDRQVSLRAARVPGVSLWSGGRGRGLGDGPRQPVRRTG